MNCTLYSIPMHTPSGRSRYFSITTGTGSTGKGTGVQAYLGKNLVAITTPIVTPIKRLRKKARGYDAKVGVVDSTRRVGVIFGFILAKLGS